MIYVESKFNAFFYEKVYLNNILLSNNNIIVCHCTALLLNVWNITQIKEARPTTELLTQICFVEFERNNSTIHFF